MIDNKVENIKKHMEEIMKILGIEKTQSNELTPLRISKMWVNELFKNLNVGTKELDSQMKVFENVDSINEMVIMRDIEWSSVCEHHFMPFKGIANIGYIPNENIIGLSKIPRVVKFFSKKPQLQERLNKEIGEYLAKVLNPKFLVVELTATHDCVGCRGIESDCLTNTIFTSDNKDYLQEFYARLNRGDSSGS